MTPPSAYLRRLVAKGNPMPSLFDPVQLGALTAPNRILMAPLTRGRATRDHVPTPIMAEYYAQRASAGLIISEATGIRREGLDRKSVVEGKSVSVRVDLGGSSNIKKKQIHE